MSRSSRLVFFGTEDFSSASLEILLRRGWPVVAVVTKPDSAAGRGLKPYSPLVKSIAESANIDVLQPQTLADLQKHLKNYEATHGVLVAYGKIIPQAVIDAFSGGIINVHPSLLPKYRGPSPIEAAILNGDSKTGVSLMKLTAGMDEGPVYCQSEYTLNGKEDRVSLNKALAEYSALYLEMNLSAIIEGSLQPTPQDGSKATYTKLLSKKDGQTDWKEPSELLERKVRAYLGFPRLRGPLLGHEAIVTKARVASGAKDGTLVVECSPGYLEVLELVAPSGRLMSGADYLRGYHKP